MSKQKFYQVIVIGAGAAGFMAATEAAKNSKQVLLIDHSQKIGEKIRISGGGRCNFTNTRASHENYISENPNFARSALSNFRPEDFINLVESYEIKYHEKKLGQLFCDLSSSQIIDLLHREANKHKVVIRNPVKVHKITKTEVFILETEDIVLTCDSLVIATGGLSIPKIGATSFAHDIAKDFEHSIVETRAALVPLVCKEKIFHDLAGSSFDAELSCDKQSFREDILFTHRGLSGPATLQISSYWQSGQTININLCPELSVEKYLTQVKEKADGSHKRKIKNLLKELKFPNQCNIKVKSKITREQIFPEKFIDYISSELNLEKILAEASKKEIKTIGDKLNHWQIVPSDTEGYTKAEVTAGGINTKELDSKTMESKFVPGLYFIGEAVDVTGWLGGYNFQWAWASGYACGKSLR